ncbi:MAG: STAS-like domain-containing protein [Terriglobia bacterium]
MSRVRIRGESIRRFILENVEAHSGDISKLTSEHFGITRQAVNKHLHRLKSEQALTDQGHTRNRAYRLSPLSDWAKSYYIAPDLTEDVVWTDDVAKALGNQPDNILDIWQYGFTEMFNNAKDHSEGTGISVRVRKNAMTTEMMVWDNGVGIFRKIQRELNLLDERHAILELSKGKLTTDPRRHTGEGIFFTSRMFDSFDILSGGCFFTHRFDDSEDWLLERESTGTFIWMKLSNHTARSTKEIFDQYVSGDDYGFTKTVVPVKLAQYGNDKLISRSQARRVLARVELFQTVVFDFKGVPTIGHAFADEIFRVFANEHPKIHLAPINMDLEVGQMVKRAQLAQIAGIVPQELRPQTVELPVVSPDTPSDSDLPSDAAPSDASPSVPKQGES